MLKGSLCGETKGEYPAEILALMSPHPYFGGLRSFKVIDVGTTGKLVSSACYDKQQVCVYLQPFSRYTSQ